ncbi:MAG: ribosomal protein S9 [uncultured bacterium]|nr:MAG: ribosomal protein S9 [uncultured bacterium]MDD2656018.1 30S ribosomal protein S9 [Patescibacteria group bacterium]OGH83661.1 MAG: 30S ribosomal protein S9 [Candidatus Magasanikbacteria bacterium RIFOXYC12_FULL_32_21b]OGH89688.1 MAG: 30S ribosomal protein S9 [Candidatus Magasanikbacteria bacterium RIFOXYD12_FULL_33_17]
MVQKSDDNKARAVGRRKTAAARVRITLGKGKITINDKELTTYFTTKLLQDRVIFPLVVVGKEKDMDVSVKVAGGGIRGQSDAVCHGIARALVEWNEELKPVLKANNLMTRDSRAKERKKPGLHKARRAHQWRKR